MCEYGFNCSLILWGLALLFLSACFIRFSRSYQCFLHLLPEGARGFFPGEASSYLKVGEGTVKPQEWQGFLIWYIFSCKSVPLAHLVALVEGGKSQVPEDEGISWLLWQDPPGGASGEELACQCRRHERCGFHPWIRKILCRRAWQPTPVFLSGGSPWTEDPGGLPSLGSHRVGCKWNNLECTHMAGSPWPLLLVCQYHQAVSWWVWDAQPQAPQVSTLQSSYCLWSSWSIPFPLYDQWKIQFDPVCQGKLLLLCWGLRPKLSSVGFVVWVEDALHWAILSLMGSQTSFLSSFYFPELFFCCILS